MEEPLIERYRSLLDEQDQSLKIITITFFTDAENKIISASPTAAYLQPSENQSRDLDGMPFHQAAGLDPESTRQLLQNLRENGSQSNRTFHVHLADQPSVKAHISGVANFNVADRYIGSDITMTIRIKPDRIIQGIDPEEPSTAPSEKTDATVTPEEKMVTHFFVGKLHALYVIVFRFGGINAAKSMQRIFNSNARRLEAAVQMDGSNLVFESKTHDLPRCSGDLLICL